jgi:hypothetical protein
MSLYKITSSRRIDTKPMVFELDIQSPPEPLILLINPASLELKFTSKISEQRVRWTGANPAYIFHAHHDELDVLSASGKSAMFMSDKGLTRSDRKDTLAFENMERLVAIYRNNGTNRNKKANSSVNPCAVDSIGRVVISYDGFVYKGHFTNFSWSENEMNPFNVDFTFEFKVTRTFSVDQVNENGILSRFNKR